MEKDEKEKTQDMRKIYEIFRQQYNLPTFDELAQEFDVEKIAEKETSFVLREIRRAINEKLSAYLHLFESLLNPQATPIFLLTALRETTVSNKEFIKETYNILAKIQLDSIKLDTVYSEEKEAEHIREAFKEWEKIKGKIYSLFENFEKGFDKSSENSKSGYFG